ncbi:MAG: AsmA-like C-terminal region-containing protein [Bacteroidales bacterium]|jgi:hypothetical protein|nr:AsmA-like C-terminal region-containing protein [Bacteroidales bacterium]NLO41606.1 AsmA-like C-terminal region-containing protein [Bacteroidales bacterium]
MNETKNNSFKQKHQLKKWCLILSCVVFFFILTAIVSAFIFEDKIADVVLKELYKSVKTEVKHKDISFSLLRKFPLASLQINNLKVKGYNDTEDLLTAKYIFLQFNIIDVLRSNYKLKRIEINQANLQLKTFSDNTNNWDIFQIQDSTTNEFSIHLKTIKLQDVSIKYNNIKQNTKLMLWVNKFGAKGNFSEQIFDMQLQTECKLQEFRLNSTIHISQRHLNIASNIHIDQKKQAYQLKNGKIRIDNYQFVSDILLTQKKNHINYSIHLKGNKLPLKDILKEMPSSTQHTLSKYESSGDVTFDLTARGATGQTPSFQTKASFSLNKGSIKNIESDISLSQIKLNGTFEAGNIDIKQNGILDIKEFSALIKNKTLNGNIYIKNFVSPLLCFHLVSEVNLEDWQSFMPENYIYKTKGASSIDLHFKNQFSSSDNFTTAELRTAEINGRITLKDVFIQLAQGETAFNELNGTLDISNQSIRLIDLNGSINNNKFLLNGNIYHFFDYLFTNQENMHIVADVSSPYVNVNQFFSDENQTNTQSNKKQESFTLTFPKRIDLTLDLHINKFVFDNFESQQIEGKAEWKNEILNVNNLTLNAFGGKIYTSGYAQKIKNNQYALYCNAKIKDANVQKLFYAFNNFGQSESGITDEHIRGIASTNILFKATTNDNLNIRAESVDVIAYISVENGQLIHFQPLESLSKFVELEDLRNIRFAKLENRILIKNQTITIPEMDINNNALNLSLSGTQTFDGQIDYKIKMKLNDLLANKFRSNRKNKDDFGEVVDDGTGNNYIHISANGDLDNPHFKWDRKQSKSNVKEQIKDQKKEFNTIFKQDTIINKRKDKDLNDYKTQSSEIEMDDDW